jgi:signal transduction histidine kinase
MDLINFLKELNIINSCRRRRLALWQCPQFIFLLMGLLIISSLLLTYFLANRFISDPLIVNSLVFALALVLMILNYLITNSFEKLAEVLKIKSDFISIVSHQLRTPLASLRWSFDAIDKRLSPNFQKEIAEYLNLVKENVEKMNELVASLLTVSRIEEGRLPALPEAFDLGQLLEKVINNFKIYAQAKEIKIEFFKETNLPLALADPQQIEQVISNLLDNALKYSRERTSVQVRLIKFGKLLKCEIEDQGFGINKAEQKYLFNKFFRGESAFRAQTSGSGLGLFIAKSIVERNRGQMGFVSKPGFGSIFWFTLPAKN